jgi:hypothetical protein
MSHGFHCDARVVGGLGFELDFLGQERVGGDRLRRQAGVGLGAEWFGLQEWLYSPRAAGTRGLRVFQSRAAP